MKALLVVLALTLLSLGNLRADSPRFILVTTETSWDNDWTSPAGEVEIAVDVTPQGFTIIGNGKRLVVPAANAKEITAADAAIALMVQREKLYAALAKAEASTAPVAQAGQPPRPTQYNGRPLPRNWIDPKQADQNFFMQQQNAELQKLNRTLNQK